MEHQITTESSQDTAHIKVKALQSYEERNPTNPQLSKN